MELKPTWVVDLSNDAEGIVRYHILGMAKVDKGGEVYKNEMAIEARWIGEDWYFSGLRDVIEDWYFSGLREVIND
ncbi:hypothetical protein [Pyrinomonas methylaliphatogenes]|uniref:hypothetical protein n=1 Tax=Pyrinomonas methylaliphatogenes TaxID=454194 RepID=UPI0005A7E139|nr:hypothetical protein [Pyrinomonas methylaliphatogenes]